MRLYNFNCALCIVHCALILHHFIRARFLAGDDSLVFLEDVRKRHFVAAAGFGGACQCGDVEVVSHAEAQVAPVEEETGDNSVVHAVEEASADGKVAVLLIAPLVFEQTAEQDFIVLPLECGVNHRVNENISFGGEAGRESAYIFAVQLGAGAVEMSLVGFGEVVDGKAGRQGDILTWCATPYQAGRAVEEHVFLPAEIF